MIHWLNVAPIPESKPKTAAANRRPFALKTIAVIAIVVTTTAAKHQAIELGLPTSMVESDHDFGEYFSQ